MHQNISDSGKGKHHGKPRILLIDDEEIMLDTLFEVLINSFETMQETLSRYKLAANPPDLLISIPKNICAAHEFFRASELIEAGAWWTRRTLETAGI